MMARRCGGGGVDGWIRLDPRTNPRPSGLISRMSADGCRSVSRRTGWQRGIGAAVMNSAYASAASGGSRNVRGGRGSARRVALARATGAANPRGAGAGWAGPSP